MTFWKLGKKTATRTIFGATGVDTEKPAASDVNFKQFIQDDAVLNSNLKQLTDAIFEFYPQVDSIDENKASLVKERNEQLKKVNFGQKLKDNFASLWHSKGMFFEIVMNGTKLKEFYMIDADTIKLTENDVGTITKIVQTQPDGDKELSLDRIIHIKPPSVNTGSLALPLLTPLKYPLERKLFAQNTQAGLVANLNPLLYLNLIETDDIQVKAIQNELRAKKDPLDPMKIISLLEDEKVTRLDTGTTQAFEDLNIYIDRQNDEIVRVVQIPPIVAGTVDNSNRSNSEIQERAVFGRTVSAWHNWYIEQLDLAMIKFAKWEDTFFEFPETDERKQEQAIIRASKLRELGYSNEAVHDVLIQSGIKIKPEFEEMETDIAKDKGEFESRQLRDKSGIPQNEAQRQQDVQNGTKKTAQ